MLPTLGLPNNVQCCQHWACPTLTWYWRLCKMSLGMCSSQSASARSEKDASKSVSEKKTKMVVAVLDSRGTDSKHHGYSSTEVVAKQGSLSDNLEVQQHKSDAGAASVSAAEGTEQVKQSKKRKRPGKRARARQKKQKIEARAAAAAATAGGVELASEVVGDGAVPLRPIDGLGAVPSDPEPAAASTAAAAASGGGGDVAGEVVGDGVVPLRSIDGLGAVPSDPEPPAPPQQAMSDYLWMSYAPRYGDPGSPLLIAFDEADPEGKAVQRCFSVDEVRNERAGQGFADHAWRSFVDRVVEAGQLAYKRALLSGTADTYEPPLFHPHGSGSGFPEGDTAVPCPVKNAGKAGCLIDAWLCALPRRQGAYIAWARKNLPGIMTFDELVARASYTDKEAESLGRRTLWQWTAKIHSSSTQWLITGEPAMASKKTDKTKKKKKVGEGEDGEAEEMPVVLSLQQYVNTEALGYIRTL
eukprot:g4484.t1